jgi:hypothetical protein
MNPTKLRKSYAFVVADTVDISKRDLVGIDTTTGYLTLWDDDAKLLFAGVADDDCEGDGVATVGVDMTGPIMERQVVVSAATIASVGNVVYAPDESSFDMNATSNTHPVGVIVRFHGVEDCDVLLQSMKEYKDLMIMDGILNPPPK